MKKFRIVIEVEGGKEDCKIIIGDEVYEGKGLALFMDSPQEGNLVTFFWNRPSHAAKAVVRGCAKAIEAGDEVATQFYRAILKGFASATGVSSDVQHVDAKEVLERWEARCSGGKDTVH